MSPIPIGWLMKKEGLNTNPFVTTAMADMVDIDDDGLGPSHRPKPIVLPIWDIKLSITDRNYSLKYIEVMFTSLAIVNGGPHIVSPYLFRSTKR